MVVIVGSSAARLGDRDVRAVGLAVDVARAAVGAGAVVQVVGRVGDDPTGDAVLLDMAASGIGHVAVLRAAGQPTPVRPELASDDERALGAALDDELAEASPPEARAPDDGLTIDAGDLDLALRYLPDYRVLVVAADLDRAAWSTVVAAASWSGAHLVALIAPEGEAPDLPGDATILERAGDDADGTFAALVGRYVAALDAGEEPRVAFAQAARGAGWANVVD